MAIKTLQIFLSSPGDVSEERDIAQEVIQSLNNDPDFNEDFHLILRRWDDDQVELPMSATDTPQKSVDLYLVKPSACDLVLVIFWSRMGTSLIMDGREYLSGTHYEYSEALEGEKLAGKPDVWIYKRTQSVSFDPDDDDFEKKLAQYRLVKEFVADFYDEAGRIKGGVNLHDDPAHFKSLLDGQLKTYLRHLRKNPTASPVPETKKHYEGVPYKGLQALDEADAPIFFGRERETLEVLAKLASSRFVFVLGASGSGKSSLTAAGVLPKLRERGKQIIRFVPGKDPFFNLALGIVKAFPTLPQSLEQAESIADQLRKAPERLEQQLSLVLNGAEQVVIFADQFEELFTQAERELGADEIRQFSEMLRYPSATISIVATMRADFLQAAIPYFESELRKGTFTLGQPSLFKLRDMIEKPAQITGVQLQDGLSERMVQDAGHQSGGLALLSYLLESLYERVIARDDKQMSLDDYEALGGVAKSIANRAEQTYESVDLPDEVKQATLRRVFSELIEPTLEDGQVVATRRRVNPEIFAGDEHALLLIQAFTEARLLVSDEGSLEVAHEALFREWDELKDWIVLIGDDMRLIRQYERDALDWEKRGRIADEQPRHEQLVYFEQALKRLDKSWADLSSILQIYTEAETTRLLREIEIIETSQQRRRDIGDRLSVIGDPRPGVGVREDGVPDIVWCAVDVPDELAGKKIEFFDVNNKKYGEFEIKPFYIAKYPITYAQYSAFVGADDGYKNSIWSQGFPDRYHSQELHDQRSKLLNNPRDSISWYESVVFSRWLDKKYQDLSLFKNILDINEFGFEIRLPLEWEWQWAAQNGLEKRKYAWGDWQDNYSNTGEVGLSRAIAVGMYPHGKAECGAFDLSGNQEEWCLNKHDKPEEMAIDASGDNRALRGGSFSDLLSWARSASRSFNNPLSGFSDFSIRLVVAPVLKSVEDIKWR